MKKRLPSKQKTGGTRMKQLGYKPIQIWVDPQDMQLLTQAAAADWLPITRFMLRAGLDRARKVLMQNNAVN